MDITLRRGKAKCKYYFKVFAIAGELWVKIAIMHFVGSVAFWLKSVDPMLRHTP